MNKKIFILEPSKTTQSLLKKKFVKSGFTPYFEADGIKMLFTMNEKLPDAIMLNAKGVNPKTSVLVRLLKSVDLFKKIPIAVYATSDFSFENTYMINTQLIVSF